MSAVPLEHDADDDDVLSAAVHFASLGWHVFPTIGKDPIEVSAGRRQRWSQESTDDPEKIVSWYAGTSGLGIGLDCGKSGLVALDADRFADFLEWLRELGDPSTLLAGAAVWQGNPARSTFLFRQREDVVGCPKMPGGEVKGRGGYVVLPPSPHPEHGHYRWLRQIDDPGVLPAEIRAHLRSSPLTGASADLPDAWPRNVDPSLRCRQVTDTLEHWSGRIAGAVGGRHDAMLGAQIALAVHGATGHVGAADALRELRERYVTAVATDRGGAAAAGAEYDRALSGAVGQGLATAYGVRTCLGPDCAIGRLPADLEELALASSPTTSVAPEVDPLEVELFDATPLLRALEQAARAQRVSPWAVLGAAMLHVLAVVRPFVVLPALVGGRVSLNSFLAIVGPSGSGKDSALRVVEMVLDVGEALTVRQVGSGEGIAHAYVRRVRSADGVSAVESHTTSVLFVVPEVDSVGALSDRSGSTLLPELRKAYMGDALGFAYADPSRNLPVPRHSYRLGLILGVQPNRAGPLLDDADGGTPQRFLWLPALDPHAPDVAPAMPERIRWRPPAWPMADMLGIVDIAVCDTAREQIDAARLARIRGIGDPLDGHALLAREKTAAGLALLHGEADVTEQWWHLAGIVHAVSDRTRADVVTAVREVAQRSNRARAYQEADRAVIVEESRDKQAVAAVARRVVERCRDGEWHTTGDLRRALRSSRRQYLDEALDRAVAAGQLECDMTEKGARYRLAEVTR